MHLLFVVDITVVNRESLSSEHQCYDTCIFSHNTGHVDGQMYTLLHTVGQEIKCEHRDAMSAHQDDKATLQPCHFVHWEKPS